MSRDVISDEAWAVIGPLFPRARTTGRPPVDRWTVVEATIVRVHQHGATLPRTQGAGSKYKKFGDEPPDHAIGRSRGGLTTKNHLVCDGKGRALAFILTAGQAADTSMLTATLSELRSAPGAGRGLAPTG